MKTTGGYPSIEFTIENFHLVLQSTSFGDGLQSHVLLDISRAENCGRTLFIGSKNIQNLNPQVINRPI